MNTVLNGSDLGLFFKNGTGNTQTLIAHSTSHKVDIKQSLREISSKDSGLWKTKASGRMEWSISTDALVSYDANAFSYEKIYDLMINRTPVTIYSSVYENSTAKTGTVSYTGDAYITSLSTDYKDQDNVTMSISLEGSGEYKKVTI